MLAFVGLICCVLFVNLNALPADYMMLPRMLPTDIDKDPILNSDTMLKAMPPMWNSTFVGEFPPNEESIIQVAPPYLPMD